MSRIRTNLEKPTENLEIRTSISGETALVNNADFFLSANSE
jgi:hypothetical protein